MNGLLGSYSLIKGITQSIYVCNTSDGATLTLNICNRNNKSVNIRVAVSDAVSNPVSSEFIEYEVEVAAKGVLERTGIVIGLGQYLTLYSSESNVTATCWGATLGDTQTVTPISVNSIPNWSADPTLTVYANRTTSVSLLQSDPINLTYNVTSGSPPSGLSLNSSTAVLSGTPSIAGYSSNGVTSTFDVTATGGAIPAVKTFNIVRKWYDGSTRELAETSASLIKTNTGLSTDGIYWINLPTLGPTQMYCDMNTDGGGWMMFAYMGSTGAPAGDSLHCPFHSFGTIAPTRVDGQATFFRFDIARLMTGGSVNSWMMWRRTTVPNNILIHTVGELWNRMPNAPSAGNLDLNGTGSGYAITTMKMSNSGPAGIVVKTNGRYESGPAYPGIAWNSTYNENSDNVGSFSTFLNRRSLIYWETNGPRSQNQWFHASPLEMGPSTSATNGQSRKDIEVYFKL